MFASANQKQIDAVISSGRISADTVEPFAHNRLVIIFPKDNPAKITALQDLAKTGLRLVLAAKEVPVGQYSLDFLNLASQDPGLGPDYPQAVLKNVVSYEENVKAVLAKVELGEADAGIVYASDLGNVTAAQGDAAQVGKINIPDALNVIATYRSRRPWETSMRRCRSSSFNSSFHQKVRLSLRNTAFYRLKNKDSEKPAGRRLPSAKRWTEKAWLLLAAPLLLFFMVPIVMLLTRTSPQRIIESLGMETVQLAVWVSLRTTLVSLVIILLFGTPLGYWMGRHDFRLKRLVDTLIDLPTVLPPSVAGVALLITFGRRGVIGGWIEDLGIQIAFTQAAVILAQVFIAAPFYVKAAALGFAGVDQEIIEAAQLDGASRWHMLRHIMLPITRSALLSGSMMSWARALGEFGATIIFAGNFPGRTQTMPTAIYLGFEMDLQMALSLSAILVLISLVSILLVKGIVSQSSG